MAFSSPCWLVKGDPAPWSAPLRPGVSSMGTRVVEGGAHKVLLGAVVEATVWGSSEEA